MKKRIITLVSAVILICLLCGCAAKIDSSAKKLEKKGYTVNMYDAELLEKMENNMIYGYGGDGKILSAFSAVNENENVVVIEFSLKSDLEIMYRELSKGISQNEKIDLSGNILAYGTEKAVKTALK